MSNFANRPANYLAASGAAAPVSADNYFPITVAGVGAITLALPTVEGQRCTFQDLTGHAHTVTTPSNGINGLHTTLTFGGTVAQFADLIAVTSPQVGSPPVSGLTWMVLASSGITIS